MLRVYTKTGWLPSSQQEEIEITGQIIDYGFKDTSYSLAPIAQAHNIDENTLIEWGNPENKGYLPSGCFFAIKAIEERQEETDAFADHIYRDRFGRLWKELHLLDDSGNWYIHERVQLA